MRAEVTTTPLVVAGRRLATDQLGYLLDPADWTEQVAQTIAEHEGITLGREHWAVIGIVRDWFEERQSVPEARVLLKAMRLSLGEEHGTRRYLHQLFPYGYGSQVCKIAGMTMPRKVMLDV